MRVTGAPASMAEVVAATSTLQIRPAAPGDVAFVSATWKQSYWRESNWANRITWKVFDVGHSRIVRSLLEKSQVLIAGVGGDDIAGYLVFEPGVSAAVHYAYVKPSFRKMGVLRALLYASGLPDGLSGCVVTHGTRAWFSAPPVIDKSTRAVLKPARPGMEEKYRATYDPYRGMCQ